MGIAIFSIFYFPVNCGFNWEGGGAETFDRKKEYSKDTDTHAIMTHLITYKPDDWPNAILSTIDSKYYPHLKRGYLKIYNDRLVYLKPILMESRYIALLIVPNCLRRQLFSHYHAGPSGGHMGEYKTLYCLRSRLFWTKTR